LVHVFHWSQRSSSGSNTRIVNLSISDIAFKLVLFCIHYVIGLFGINFFVVTLVVFILILGIVLILFVFLILVQLIFVLIVFNILVIQLFAFIICIPRAVLVLVLVIYLLKKVSSSDILVTIGPNIDS